MSAPAEDTANNPLSREQVIELIRSTQHRPSSKVSELAGVKLDSKGLQIQLDCIQEVDSCLLEVQELVEEGVTINANQLLQPLAKAREALRKRAKVLRIADAGGWLAVQQYQGFADIGDNPDDAKKILKAVQQANAVKSQKSRERGYGLPRYTSRYNQAFGSGVPTQGTAPYIPPKLIRVTRNDEAYPALDVDNTATGSTNASPAVHQGEALTRFQEHPESVSTPREVEVPRAKVEKCVKLVKDTMARPSTSARSLAKVTAEVHQLIQSSFLLNPQTLPHIRQALETVPHFLLHSKAPATVKQYLSSVAGLGLHSLRAGGATLASNQGADPELVREHGRWKSCSSRNLYVRPAQARRIQVTAAMLTM